jgi:hypothetical protein
VLNVVSSNLFILFKMLFLFFCVFFLFKEGIVKDEPDEVEESVKPSVSNLVKSRSLDLIGFGDVKSFTENLIATAKTCIKREVNAIVECTSLADPLDIVMTQIPSIAFKLGNELVQYSQNLRNQIVQKAQENLSLVKSLQDEEVDLKLDEPSTSKSAQAPEKLHHTGKTLAVISFENLPSPIKSVVVKLESSFELSSTEESPTQNVMKRRGRPRGKKTPASNDPSRKTKRAKVAVDYSAMAKGSLNKGSKKVKLTE